jgi:hypothetical protein
MPVNRLYHTWIDRIRQLCPEARRTLTCNFTWLLVGMYLSRKVHLSLIANKIPGYAKLNSKVQRLRRLLLGPISVRKWYDPVAAELLESQAQQGHVRLIVDGSRVSFHHQLLMVSIAYRRRAIPIVWTWVKGSRGHSSALKQLALLRHVHTLIPKNVSVSLVGDSEFGAVALLCQLDNWEWQYALRQKGNTLVDLTLHNHWQPFAGLVRRPGQSYWFREGFLTEKHYYCTNLLAYWKRGEERPWLLASSFPTQRETLRAYRVRMWIEEMFGDFKGHGFDLESSHLCHFQRLSRLTLAVVLLYLWLVVLGSHVIKNGLRSLVDRTDRRDFSIFRIGYNMVERCLANTQPFSISFIPYF